VIPKHSLILGIATSSIESKDVAFFGRGMMGVVMVALSVHFAAVYLRTRRLPPDRENP
jgi:hypothetical protein